MVVIVPSYGRPDHLRKCLTGLADQIEAPDAVVVVARESDVMTLDLVARMTSGLEGLRVTTVAEPGVIAAMRTGIEVSGESIIAFIDDDAIPSPSWLKRMHHHFLAADVGGVGGRDIIEGSIADSTDVGRVSSWGRLIGRHDRGTGPSREVDVLKGVNMAFRREALALPMNLRGPGAQVHWEVATCQWSRERGWRLIYDPMLTVEHSLAPRPDDHRRVQPSGEAVRNTAFNYELSLLGNRPGLGTRRLLHGILVGDREAPGILRAIVALGEGELGVARGLWPAVAGRIAALRMTRRPGALNMWSPGPG